MKARTMLGAFIEQRMAELGLTVRDVAESTRLTEGAIYLIRQGNRTKLHPGTWLALSDALNVPVRELMDKVPQDGKGPRAKDEAKASERTSANIS